MSKATPGPWSHLNGRIFQTNLPELPIAYVARSFDGDYSPSNGDLLAAAPELLEALKACLQTLTDSRLGTYQYMEGSEIYSDFRKSAEKARAAIDKATGVQP